MIGMHYNIHGGGAGAKNKLIIQNGTHVQSGRKVLIRIQKKRFKFFWEQCRHSDDELDE